MRQKDRLLKALRGEKVDRPPVICPGGMMSPAITEVLQNVSGNHFTDAAAMKQTALQINEQIGFENYGVPYCMTVEAEELGAGVDYGSKTREARISNYAPLPVEEWIKASDQRIEEKRSAIVLDAIKGLKNTDVPVIGNISGHISVATSLFEPVDVYKLFYKKPSLLDTMLGRIGDHLVEFSKSMVQAGADVIAISDPSATGEIVGTKNFVRFCLPLYKNLIHAIHKEGVPVVLHICGSAKNIIEEMEQTGADALSFDSVVSITGAKSKVSTPIMGNVSTLLLSIGTEEKIKTATRFALSANVDIVAPACGLGMETSVKNLRAMVRAVEEAPM